MSSKPETVIKPPNRFLGVFDIKELKRRIDLLFAFAERDIKVRYRRTLIGIGWAIIQPLFQMIIFSIIFGKFAKLETGTNPLPCLYILSFGTMAIFLPVPYGGKHVSSG